MRRLPSRVLLSLLAAIVLAAAMPSAAVAAKNKKDAVRDVAKRIDARYNSMRTLRADFTQIYSGAGIRRSETGILTLKKPGKMRWDYLEPREKLFVTDGKTAWFYMMGQQQARRTSLKKLDDLRSPLRYLLGRTKLEKEFRGLSLAVDVTPHQAGNVVLRGIPKGMEERVSEVILESDPQGYLRWIRIDELDGTRTEFHLERQRENIPVADREFHFRPPAGIEVLRGDQLAP
jgi:outer membrane lipoprotein carrier protein